ncbi:MAG: DMT family transporter [Victivallales bacterium]|nr:DMT family transporter [Victivallales bacterium]
MKNSVTASYISMAMAWLVWSMDPILIRVIGDDVARPVMVGVSMTLAGLILLLPALRGYFFLAKRRDLWGSFLFYIIFATVIAELLYVMAIRNLNPGLVGLTLRSQVIMAILSAWFFFGERPNISTIIGIVIVVLGYGGTAYFMKPDVEHEGRQCNAALGWSCAIAAAVLWTSGTLLGKKLMENIKSSHLCGMRMLTAGIVTSLVYICAGGGKDFLMLNREQWWFMLVKSAVCSALGYTLYMFGLHLAPVTAAAAMEQAAPLFTLCVATFVIHEPIAAMQWGTVAVVFLGAAIILVSQYRKAKS